jgi:hypothetical protein
VPSHDHTAFQFWPDAITPGIAVEEREVGAGGGAELASDAAAPGMEKGCGGVLHLASTLGAPTIQPIATGSLARASSVGAVVDWAAERTVSPAETRAIRTHFRFDECVMAGKMIT